MTTLFFYLIKNAIPLSLTGRIYYDSSYANILQDSGFQEIPVEMVVLNDNNEEVNGTAANELGTKIIMYLPEEAQVDAQGTKNVQVINPKRESNDLGDSSVAIDLVEFIVATDEPVIETVDPNIVTLDGGSEVKVTGTNFQEGIKVYIDGAEVSGVTREIDVEGNNVVLTFNAPAGREGETQLQVVNTGGGLDVRDFFYIQTFNQDPTISLVSPNRGTEDTVVTVEGTNFFKPDPTAASTSGVDAYRLIGSRIKLDGDEINSYNYDALDNIDFVDYTAPDEDLIFVADTQNDVVDTSPFYENAYIYDTATNDVYELSFDGDGNPLLYDDGILLYQFAVDSNVIHAYDINGTDLGTVTVGLTSLTFGSENLTVNMNNQVLSVGRDDDFTEEVRLADYWYSVVLQDVVTSDYYNIYKELDGDIYVSNGSFRYLQDSTKFK